MEGHPVGDLYGRDAGFIVASVKRLPSAWKRVETKSVSSLECTYLPDDLAKLPLTLALPGKHKPLWTAKKLQFPKPKVISRYGLATSQDDESTVGSLISDYKVGNPFNPLDQTSQR